MASGLSLTYPLLLVSLIYSYARGGNGLPAAINDGAAASTRFIRTSCRVTRYPVACVRSLSTHASAIQKSRKRLVMTALSVSVERAQFTKAFVRKLYKFRGLRPREYAAIKDCIEEVGDSVDQLVSSVRELQSLGRTRGPDFEWHMSNLQTWVSAALTDDSTCSDGFSGRNLNWRIKNSIRNRMTEVAQLTSNALALCNKFAGKY